LIFVATMASVLRLPRKKPTSTHGRFTMSYLCIRFGTRDVQRCRANCTINPSPQSDDSVCCFARASSKHTSQKCHCLARKEDKARRLAQRGFVEPAVAAISHSRLSAGTRTLMIKLESHRTRSMNDGMIRVGDDEACLSRKIPF
jgi:hypothetical protein